MQVQLKSNYGCGFGIQSELLIRFLENPENFKENHIGENAGSLNSKGQRSERALNFLCSGNWLPKS